MRDASVSHEFTKKDAGSKNKKVSVIESSVRTHEITREDAAVMTAMRAAVLPFKGKLRGSAARESFNGIMERVSPPENVAFHPDTVGGVSGLWCKPTNARFGEAILHLHGGWFNLGSAQAHRNLVGHIAVRTGAEAFVPDYRLAPEHPFPAAKNDVQACYRGLVERGIRKIAISGDSAGGNLALVMLSLANKAGGPIPVGAAVLSPVTDLALTGESFETRAEADPYFVRAQVEELIGSYLGDTDPKNSLASPLYGNLAGLPPISIHVGEDEILLDDSRRYFERAVAAGVDARLDVWGGMPHGFVGSVGNLSAATEALDAIAEFLAQRLKAEA
jgi:monoterpene epsilon-lactone hydrolase